MADPIPDYYLSSFGGLRLWISRISTDKSRSQVVHEMSSGDDFTVQDKGRALMRSRASVQFDYMDGDDLTPIQRVRALSGLVDDRPRMFSHPIEGSFLAHVGPFNYDAESTGVITAEIEFVPAGDVQPVSSVGAGGIPASGVGAVDIAADAMTSELADVGMTSTLPTDASAAADSWSSTDTVNPRDIFAQEGSLSAQLGTQADELDNDIGLWSAYKATILMAAAVRSAAEVATSDTADSFVVRVAAPIALRALLCSIYPAEDADLRYTQAMALNDISTPAWIEPGTELLLPLQLAQARNG